MITNQQSNWKYDLVDRVDSGDFHCICSECFIRVFGYIGSIIRDIGVIRQVCGSHNDVSKLMAMGHRAAGVTNGDFWQDRGWLSQIRTCSRFNVCQWNVIWISRVEHVVQAAQDCHNRSWIRSHYTPSELSTCCSLDERFEFVGIWDRHLLESFVHILNKLYSSLPTLRNILECCWHLQLWNSTFMSRVFPISPPFTSWLVMVYNVPAPCNWIISLHTTDAASNAPGPERQYCWIPGSLTHRWAAWCWRWWGFSGENRNSHPQRRPFPP